ncbi:MAG: hypothetical protein ACRDGT_12600, partial [Candidatus Limnocylindria bacterium]
ARRHAPARGSHRPARAAARRADAAWETRSFGAASAAILVAFVLALVYLGSSTGVATAGYEAQRLQEQRDELRRQSALLDVELATLASPARIETEAERLGLVRLSHVPVVPADPIAAHR